VSGVGRAGADAGRVSVGFRWLLYERQKSKQSRISTVWSGRQRRASDRSALCTKVFLACCVLTGLVRTRQDSLGCFATSTVEKVNVAWVHPDRLRTGAASRWRSSGKSSYSRVPGEPRLITRVRKLAWPYRILTRKTSQNARFPGYSASHPIENRSAAQISLIFAGLSCATRLPTKCCETVTRL
jgi:hypothetical protein